MSAPEPIRSRAGGPRSRRVSEQVAAEIVRYVQERALEPGSRIGTEEELAREFGVSRPTLREALRMLSSGDLVRATKGPGGGIFVANTVEKGLGRSISDFIALMLETRRVTIDELLEARMLLEVPLAGLAAYRADAEALAEIRAAVDESRANLHDRAELRRADIRIHSAIAAAAGNRVVEAFMQWTLDVLQPSLTTIIEDAVVESAIVDQHAALLRALERGDPVRAERATREHLEYLRDLLRVVEDGHESHERGRPAPRARA
jgi:GntR family transcriptional regulator, transcriptional repressor for pyruvate dehydrogenase complex